MTDSFWTLVGARVLQGLGGAMMVPVGRLIMLRAVPKAELVRAMTWLTVPALIGPVMGPPVGGFLTTYLSWRWIFWINLPIGLEIGRASCRERVCQYVWISVVAVYLNKKKTTFQYD